MSARRPIESPENRLGPMVSASRGLTPARALAEARARVRALGPRNQAEMDRRMALIAAFAARPDAPLRAEDLRGLRRHAEAALTVSGGMDQPWMGRALLLLSAQCDALAQGGAGRRDDLAPAIRAAVLLRAGATPEAEAIRLLEGLQRCLERFLADAGHDGGVQAPTP